MLPVRSLLVAGAIGAAAFLAGGAAAEVSLRLGHVGAPISPQQTIGTMFAEKVADKTGGEVTIEIFHSGTLGNERQLQEAVRSGTLDMTIAGTFSHFVPWAGSLETPLLYSDLDHFVGFFLSEAGDELMAAVRGEAGVEPLFIAPHGGFRYITTNGRPVHAPADLEGLRIRNPNVPAFNVMAEAAGAVPVPLDFAELYVALERGVVDGQHNPIGNIVGPRLYEVQEYVSMVPWGISPHIVSMSQRAWSRLSEEQQSALREAAAETAREYPAVAVEEEEALFAEIEGEIEVIRPEEIDMAAFAELFRDKGLPALKAEYGEAGGRWLDAIDAAR